MWWYSRFPVTARGSVNLTRTPIVDEVTDDGVNAVESRCD